VTDLAALRTAKARLADALKGHPRVSGVGLAHDEGGGVVLKVLLSAPADDIPGDQDGVPVVAEVVGRISRHGL
jgi:hypothetical protein